MLFSTALASCATATPVAPRTSNASTTASANSAQPVAIRWPIKTAEHIDLWLHAFAMISNDSGPVPLYRVGYRDSLTVIKNRSNVLTSLDVNRTTLATGLARSNGYLMAQFLPLDVANWDVLRSFSERFLQFEGEARRASDKETAARIQQFATIFPSAADREWFRLFVAGVTDEQLRFFADEHSRQVRGRAAVISAVDSLWQRVYRPRFDRFLTNTGQRQGDIVLSLPIGGEGRTGLGRNQQTVVVVPFPARVQDAADVLYVFAHEVTGSLVATVVADNTTPAEQRAGAADKLISFGQVRAGAMIIEKLAPELHQAYMRYYLTHVGATRDAALSGSALATAFGKRFEIPTIVRDALERQIEIVLGGI